MKTWYLSFVIFALFTVSSCGSDESVGVIPRNEGELGGNIITHTTYATGDYVLNGALVVKPGVTVTFEAGSTITADKSNGVDFILVENGGMLIINGTAAEPVVFTEASKTPGSWGGIIMYGDAPVHVSGGGNSAISEDGNALAYGGQNPTHSSGSLRYVRVEYAGKKISDGTSEMNAFTFYAVGSGTILQNLLAYKGADDGFEFFGGTASASNLVSYGNYDDAFDWQDGWQGQNNNNWLAIQHGIGNFGMEIEASNNDNNYYPIITHLTLKRLAGTLTETAGDVQYDAIQFKKEGNGHFSDILISGYGAISTATACRIQDINTQNHQVNSGKIKLTQVTITDGLSNYNAANSTFTVNFPIGNFTTSPTATGALISSGAWSVVDGVNLIQ